MALWFWLLFFFTPWWRFCFYFTFSLLLSSSPPPPSSSPGAGLFGNFIRKLDSETSIRKLHNFIRKLAFRNLANPFGNLSHHSETYRQWGTLSTFGWSTALFYRFSVDPTRINAASKQQRFFNTAQKSIKSAPDRRLPKRAGVLRWRAPHLSHTSRRLLSAHGLPFGSLLAPFGLHSGRFGLHVGSFWF